MTEFTKEKINELRKQLEVFHIDSNPVQEMQVVTTMRKALDEIERLQARVQELEEQQRNELRLSVMSVEEFEHQRERIAELEADQVQVCEWAVNKYMGAYHSPHSELLVIFEKEKDDHQFCSICGKRIKYVEVE